MSARDLRIGDAERDAAARELGDHFAQGRLDSEEYAERLDHVLAARRAGDLQAVFADLPRGAAVGPVGPDRRRPPQPSGLGLPLKVLAAFVLVILVVTHLPILVVALLVYAVAVGKVRRGGVRGRRRS